MRRPGGNASHGPSRGHPLKTDIVHFLASLALPGALALGAWLVFSAWRRDSRLRAGAINASLVLISVLAAFVAAEGYFTFFVDITDGALVTLTGRRWAARHLPLPLGTHRGRPLRPSAPGAGRGPTVAVVGDSLTFGQGIERTEDLYPSLLERALRERGLDAEVYNISMAGWDTREEWEALGSAVIRGQDFDLVVLGYCLNDIEPYVALPPGYDEAAGRLNNPPPLVAALANRSYVVSWLYHRYVLLGSPAFKTLEREIVRSYLKPEIFARHAAELRYFKELVDSIGAHLVVVTFPHCSDPWADYPYRDVHRLLDEFWKELGVRNIDLLADFERHPYDTLQVSSLDTHPNELAHRIAAERLFGALMRDPGLLAPVPRP